MKAILFHLSAILLLLSACTASTTTDTTPQPAPQASATVAVGEQTAVPIPTPHPTETAVPTLTPTLPPAADLHNNKPILYYDAADGHYYRIGLDGSQPDQLTQQPDSGHVMPDMVEQSLRHFNTPSVSPDGRYLLQYDGYHSWQLLSVPDRTPVAQDAPDFFYSPSWSPDSRQFAYLRDEHELCVFNLATLSEQCLWQSDSRLFAAEWSPDGRFIAVAEDDEGNDNDIIGLGKIWVINSATGVARPARTYSGAGEVVLGSIFSWLPGGEALLIYTVPEGGSVRYVLDSGQIFRFPDHIQGASPDGRFFYTGEGDLFDATGTLLHQAADPTTCRHFRYGHHAWSPDSSQLAFASDCNETDFFEGEWTLTIVDVVSGETVWQQVLSANYSLLDWSTEENTLLLNHRTSGWPKDTNIYTLSLDSSSEPEPIISGAVFLGSYPQWLAEE